ncbi:MAG TPA: toll/interleukin-1 receptor domain-containing protein [Candidatus Eisenbacteria bacterium]|nr:toll/interleukin-1 receptor domain-containing protein [Candidatus Eisenbacteria bacterium]
MTISPRAKRKVFLSHSSKDRAFVLRLTKVLDRHRVSYWYSASHIFGAKQWHDEIGRALAQCNWFLVVLTPNAVRSHWVKRELLYALNEIRYNEKIIPLLYKPCNHSRLSWTLGEFEFADFVGDFEQSCQNLLRIWRIKYKPPSARRGARKSTKTSRTKGV